MFIADLEGNFFIFTVKTSRLEEIYRSFFPWEYSADTWIKSILQLNLCLRIAIILLIFLGAQIELKTQFLQSCLTYFYFNVLLYIFQDRRLLKVVYQKQLSYGRQFSQMVQILMQKKEEEL